MARLPAEDAAPLRWHVANIAFLLGGAAVGFVVTGPTGDVTAACAAVGWALLAIRDRRFPHFLPSHPRRDVRAIVLLFGVLGTLTAVALAVGAIRGH